MRAGKRRDIEVEAEIVEGDFLTIPAKPEWGVGVVLARRGRSTLAVFFPDEGKRVVRIGVDRPKVVTKQGGRHAILRKAARGDWQHAHHSVYVIKLGRDVLSERRFVEANPQWDPKKPCVYVGMTGKSTEERLQDHKAGHKAARYAKCYGGRLLPVLFRSFNPMPYEVAASMEKHLARRLRKKGFGVWQN